MTAEIHSDLSKLRAKVEALSSLMREPGGSPCWADKLDSYVAEAGEDICLLADRVLGNFGSMGALNDWNFENSSRNHTYMLVLADLGELGWAHMTNDMLRERHKNTADYYRKHSQHYRKKASS